MNNELLPCPFCGGDDIELIFGDDERYSADCGNCAATGPAENNPDAAIWAWNTRVYPAEVQAAIERAKTVKPKVVLDSTKGWLTCGSCGATVVGGHNYCCHCGRRLNWSE